MGGVAKVPDTENDETSHQYGHRNARIIRIGPTIGVASHQDSHRSTGILRIDPTIGMACRQDGHRSTGILRSHPTIRMASRQDGHPSTGILRIDQNRGGPRQKSDGGRTKKYKHGTGR